MSIILTTHAKKRMSERAISFKQIKDPIEMPDYTVKKINKTEAIKVQSGRKIKVVYFEKNNYIKVISVM